jgi:glycosyltransferase involved in cell wall biosynthesis
MVSTTPFTDPQLAALYQACAVTIAPGLGEGFGYPIVESLASGTPVVHGDCGGGRELIPKIEWRFPVRETRLEGIYALQRPVFRAEDVANAIERVFSWQQEQGPEVVAAYCRGAVAHLDWQRLWPRWYKWIKAGL